MFCKIPMFTFGERLIDYLQAYECFLGALGLESSFMSFAVGRFCPMPEAADLIVLDFWDNLRKLNAKDKYFDATNDCLILTDLDAGKDRQTQITEFRDLLSQEFQHVWLDALVCIRNDWNAIHPDCRLTRAQNDILDNINFHGFWDSLMRRCEVRAAPKGEDYQLYVEADIKRIRKKGLIVFQGEDATPNTGLVLVIRNPKGRLGRPYRNLNDSWNNLMTMMLERHASNANPFMFRRLMLKYMLDRSIMTDANDGNGYFAFFAKSVISKKEWNSFLASLDENALACIAKNGVTSETAQSLCSGVPKPQQFFVDGFKPAVVWF